MMEYLDVLTTTMKNLSDLLKGITASTCTMEGSMQAEDNCVYIKEFLHPSIKIKQMH